MRDNSIYLVTGGNSGLGKATVELLLEQGAKVVIFDLKIEEVCNENVLSINGDVCSEDDVQNAVDKIRKKYGKLSGIINCAGIFAQTLFTAEKPPSLEIVTRVLNVNTTGTFNVIRLAVPLISANTPNEDGERGVIIMTSSVTAFNFKLYSGYAAYSASKGALVAMTMPLAKDFADQGIRVVSIAPSGFDTPMAGDADKRHPPHTLFPKRYGRPIEYAKCVKAIIDIPMINATTIHLDAGCG